MVKSNNLNIGEWSDVSSKRHKKSGVIYLELRLKNINKCVGKAFLSKDGGYVRAMFSTDNDAISNTLPKGYDLKNIHTEWSKLMDEYLLKIFK